MRSFTITRQIAAPPERVFEVFADLARAAERVRGIERIELLTEGPLRVGTRWRETRKMMGHEATEEIEITAVEPGRGYTAECDSCGGHFQSVFRFAPEGTGTRVEVETNYRAVSLLAKLMSPLSALMLSPMKKCLQADFADLQADLERQA